jgi:hypothetical protein
MSDNGVTFGGVTEKRDGRSIEQGKGRGRRHMVRFQPRHHRGVGLNRRELLQVGDSGLLGIGVPSIWAGQAAASAVSASKARSVVLIFLTGAPSHLDTFDLKPEAPAEIRGDFKTIATRGRFLRASAPSG